jgi:hypothetical protein
MRFHTFAITSILAAMPTLSAFIMPQSTFVMPLGRHRTTDGTAITSKGTAATTTSLSAGGLDYSLQIADATADALGSVTSNPLFVYFAERVIEAAVPTVFAVLVIYFFFGQFKSARGNAEKEDEAAENTNAIAELYNDLYGTTKGGGIGGGGKRGPFGGGGMFSPPPLPKNLGLPQKEYLKVTSLNEKLDAYDFSLQRATTSKARAAATFRSKSFDRAVGLALNADDSNGGTVPAPVRAKLVRAERAFLSKGKELVQELRRLEGSLAQITIDAELKKMGLDDPPSSSSSNKNGTAPAVLDAEIVVDAETTEAVGSATVTNTTTEESAELQLAANPTRSQEELLKKMAKTQKSLMELELGFIQQVLSAVGPKRAVGLRNALLGDIAVRGTGGLLTQLQERPLTTILRPEDAGSDGTSSRPKNLYVMRFPGDVQASQLNELREEVTGVIRNAQPGDEALVVLQSGGGTVTGYGLAAGQLVRLKEKGLYLTIAVEQVAASGGYMMSCVADRIVASPFAVLGSIGVISEIPNVYERLKQEGM